MPRRRPDTRPDTIKRPAWAARFLARLAETGNVTRAAKAAKVNRPYAYEFRAAHDWFAAAWAEAVAEAVEGMADEARRRAVEGTLRPVFQGGKRVGAVREFSDTLLIFLLKAHGGPKYRDANRLTVAGDATAPVRHAPAGSVFDRIAEFTAQFAEAAGASESAAPSVARPRATATCPGPGLAL